MSSQGDLLKGTLLRVKTLPELRKLYRFTMHWFFFEPDDPARETGLNGGKAQAGLIHSAGGDLQQHQDLVIGVHAAEGEGVDVLVHGVNNFLHRLVAMT